MIKLYVNIWGGSYDDDLGYVVSEELAEFLRRKNYKDHWDDMDEEERTCDDFELELDSKKVRSMISDKSLPEHLREELNVIDSDASRHADELAIEEALDYNPYDWDEYEWMEKDIENNLFAPEKSFEQFLEESDWDPADEDYDEEDAHADYYGEVSDSYESWVETLPASDRAERYGLNDYSDIDYGYMFNFINKAAKDDEQ